MFASDGGSLRDGPDRRRRASAAEARLAAAAAARGFLKENMKGKGRRTCANITIARDGRRVDRQGAAFLSPLRGRGHRSGPTSTSRARPGTTKRPRLRRRRRGVRGVGTRLLIQYLLSPKLASRRLTNSNGIPPDVTGGPRYPITSPDRNAPTVTVQDQRTRSRPRRHPRRRIRRQLHRRPGGHPRVPRLQDRGPRRRTRRTRRSSWLLLYGELPRRSPSSTASARTSSDCAVLPDELVTMLEGHAEERPTRCRRCRRSLAGLGMVSPKVDLKDRASVRRGVRGASSPATPVLVAAFERIRAGKEYVAPEGRPRRPRGTSCWCLDGEEPTRSRRRPSTAPSCCTPSTR